MSEIMENKRPVTRVHHVGIEIEFFSPLARVNLAARLGEARLRQAVTLKGDSSLYDPRGRYAHELCVLTSERRLRPIVQRVCRVLREAKADVNNTCGLHVHLDMRRRNFKMVYRNLVRALPFLSRLVPDSRLNNKYCQPNFSDCLTQQQIFSSRRCAINPWAYRQHKTIEVRLHSGTVNPEKIIYWVQLLIALANVRYIPRTGISSLPELRRYVALPRRTWRYLTQRIQRFNRPQPSYCESRDDRCAQVA